MLISIITINYNNLEGLKKTIQSVLNQTYLDIEFLVIDGGSTDGSKAYIENCKDNLSYWVSEPDHGVYHAMNKGIRQSNGDYLLFLNSGDFLYDNSVLLEVSKWLTSNKDFYYGNVMQVSSNNQLQLKKFPKELSFQFFYEGTLSHQTTFIRRTLFDDLFFYNEDLIIVSDWEFFICAICKFNCSYQLIDIVVSTYNTVGISSFKENRQIKRKERSACLKKHFPAFVHDYEELRLLKSRFKTSRFKMLASIENSKYTFPRKIVSVLLLGINKVFGK